MEECVLSSRLTLGASLLCATSLVVAACEKARAPTTQPCRLEVDSPADGEVDAVFEIGYEDGRPVHAVADYGEGLGACITFGYDDDRLATKTAHQGECDGAPPEGAKSTLERVDGSNLVALTFPDGELTYHYVTVPGDFTFLATRTAYNLGPQKIAGVDIDEGLFRSLELPESEPAHTLEAAYRGGQLIRVSERGPDGVEVGYASFHYRNGRLVKVERRLRTMSEGQTEQVILEYECDK
jgi:hypothetical protein